MECVRLTGTGNVDKFAVVSIDKPTECLTLSDGFRRERGLPAVDLLDTVHVKISHFAVNYADVCIRMGLYASANRYASDPSAICPGFDFAGKVVDPGRHADIFPVGTRVFGVTMFGAYSTDVRVPFNQIFRTPTTWSDAEAAAFPTGALTAYYAVYKCCGVRSPTLPTGLGKGSTVLVHSAAGGVGRYICNLTKRLGATVVGVVGRTSKGASLLQATAPPAPLPKHTAPVSPQQPLVTAVVSREAATLKTATTARWFERWPPVVGSVTTRCVEHAIFTAAVDAMESATGVRATREDVVVAKEGSAVSPWHERARARAAALYGTILPPPPRAFDYVFDANGASTLSLSYAATKPGGTLVTYGFHSFLPQDGGDLRITSWARIIAGVITMPRFAPMDLTESNVTVSGFNLSFMFDQVAILEHAMNELLAGAEGGNGDDLVLPPLVSKVYSIHDVPAAHKDLQSGLTIGKLVISTH